MKFLTMLSLVASALADCSIPNLDCRFQFSLDKPGTSPSTPTSSYCSQPNALTLTLRNGQLLDADGRTAFIESEADHQQLSFDNTVPDSALYSKGFGLCNNGSFALNGNTDFYLCKTAAGNYATFLKSFQDDCRLVNINLTPCDGEPSCTAVSTTTSSTTTTSTTASSSTSTSSSTTSSTTTTTTPLTSSIFSSTNFSLTTTSVISTTITASVPLFTNPTSVILSTGTGGGFSSTINSTYYLPSTVPTSSTPAGFSTGAGASTTSIITGGASTMRAHSLLAGLAVALYML